MLNINYVFHIGERCNSLGFFKQSKLLSGLNLFSGLYVSFDSVIEFLNCRVDLYKNAIKFQISNLKNKDSIKFINCEEYSEEEKNKIINLVQHNKFLFFGAENYYKDKDYCINLKYTDIENLEYNDLYYMKNRYCIMPNSDYSSEEFLEIYNRRKNRFLDSIDNNRENVVLIYMDKLTHINSIEEKMNEVEKKYNFDWNLFYIIPIYNDDNSNIETFKKTNSNIIFCFVQFKNLEYQLENNRNDDNQLIKYMNEFNKIKEVFLNSYDLQIKELYS